MLSKHRWLSTGIKMPRAISQLPLPEFKIYAEREEREKNGVILEDIKAPGLGRQQENKAFLFLHVLVRLCA